MVKLVPLDRRTEQRRRSDQGELTDGEVTGDEVTTVVFPIITCIHWYPRFARRITGATSPVSMVARWWCVVVLRPSPVMACLDEHGYNIYKP